MEKKGGVTMLGRIFTERKIIHCTVKIRPQIRTGMRGAGA